MMHALTKRNIKRLRFLLLGVFLIEVLFLLSVERVRLLDNAHELVWVSYTLHLILAIFTMILFTLLFVYRFQAIEQYPFVQRLSALTTFLVLTLSGVISVFDQLTHGHITLFTVHLLAFGLLIFIKPFHNLIIFTFPFILFLIGVIFLQTSDAIRLTHLINGSIVFLGIMFSSTVFYRNYLKELTLKIELTEKNNQLEFLATIDPLTELPNRRYFERQVTYETSINRRYNHVASLLLIDIDHFKEINDRYGHDAGDYILKMIAQIFKSHVRESDTVCRWGGEEFMILLSHTTIDGASVLAHRLNKIIKETIFTYENQAMSLTISLGLTELDNDIQSGFLKSYQRVDLALYEAKKAGRDKVIIKTDS
ncbi:MAG: GGDEF domain-containing protein [Candidatus Izemoplasmataceae bacterium]